MNDEQRAKAAIRAILGDDAKAADLVELIKLQRTELLAMIILTQTLLVDKGLVTKDELDQYVSEDNVVKVAESIGRLIDGTLASAAVEADGGVSTDPQ